MKDMKTAAAQDLECCPTLSKEPCCDVLDFRYRLPHRTTVNEAGRQATITVEVILHLRLTRCPGPLSLGDPVHTITLLPGEKVKLFTSDRRKMGEFVSPLWLRTLAWITTAVIVLLNGKYLCDWAGISAWVGRAF